MKKKWSGVRGQGSAKSLISYCLFLIVLSAVCYPQSIVSAAHASPPDELVVRIQKAYDDIKDVRGRFFQTSYIKDLERTEKYEGEFFIKKPSSMRWNFSKPRDEEVIIIEDNIWIYKLSEKQVLKGTFSKDAYSVVPVALLNGLGNIKNDFDVKLIHDNTLELTPKHRMGFINKIILEVIPVKKEISAGVNPADFPIKEISVFDAYGNKIDIVVKNVKINSGLEDSLFVFKLTPDIQTFDVNQ